MTDHAPQSEPHPEPHPEPSLHPQPSPHSEREDGSVVHEFSATGPIDAAIQGLRGDIVVRAEHGTAVRVELTPHGQDGRELVREMRVRFESGRLSIDTASDAAHAIGDSVSSMLRGLGRDDDGTSWADRLATGLRSATRGVRGLAGSLDITVLVPHGSGVMVHGGAGDVRVHGVLDRVEVRAGAGDITLHRGAEQETRLTTGAGDIAVGPTTGLLSVTTGPGDVVLEEISGRTSVTTGVGDVEVRRAVSGHLAVRTGLGDVTIRVAPGTAARVDLATGLGDRDVQLTPTDGAGDAERTLEIEARSGKGDLRVMRADPVPQGS
ncbi:DUF4097 family beta strand repeat-containing protein [Brachybacterium ginsengisoli]|nr:DUF4097 family beta strand repeat-containing protein [Brachybacterium ginsengisoli]